MTGPEVQALARRLSRDDLVAAFVMLCSGVYPRIARDSALTELARRAPEGGAS